MAEKILTRYSRADRKRIIGEYDWVDYPEMIEEDDEDYVEVIKNTYELTSSEVNISLSNIAMRMHRSASPFQDERKENLENAIAELNKWANAFEVKPEIVVIETWKPE